MSGAVPIELERQFLARHNHADLQILKNIRATVEPRNRWAGTAVGGRRRRRGCPRLFVGVWWWGGGVAPQW